MPRGILRFAAILFALTALLLALLAGTQKDRKISTEILIDAPPAVVWRVLTATAEYPNWNPFLVSLKGKLAVNGQLQVTIRPPGGTEMTFTPTVLAVTPNRELAWQGNLLTPGIVRAEHRLRLESAGAGRTRLLHSEQFTGLLVGPLLRSTLDRIELGFTEMNLAVKIQSEQRR